MLTGERVKMMQILGFQDRTVSKRQGYWLETTTVKIISGKYKRKEA